MSLQGGLAGAALRRRPRFADSAPFGLSTVFATHPTQSEGTRDSTWLVPTVLSRGSGSVHNASGSYSVTMEPRGHNEGDRRSWPRYPLETALEYQVIHGSSTATGQGKTINLSSGGVLFQSDQDVAEGIQIELAIVWPALSTMWPG